MCRVLTLSIPQDAFFLSWDMAFITASQVTTKSWSGDSSMKLQSSSQNCDSKTGSGSENSFEKWDILSDKGMSFGSGKLEEIVRGNSFHSRSGEFLTFLE